MSNGIIRADPSQNDILKPALCALPKINSPPYPGFAGTPPLMPSSDEPALIRPERKFTADPAVWRGDSQCVGVVAGKSGLVIAEIEAVVVMVGGHILFAHHVNLRRAVGDHSEIYFGAAEYDAGWFLLAQRIHGALIVRFPIENGGLLIFGHIRWIAVHFR